jgi:hypothetical protein
LTTRISREFEFLAAVHYEGSFLLNSYNILLSMDVQTDSIVEQNIAMDRIKYFMHEVLDSSVFIQDAETKAIEKYQAAGLKTCILPEQPYDQIITILLLYKVNAICEGKLVISDIQLDSQLSDGVGFMYDLDELSLKHPYKTGWWTDSSTVTSDKKSVSKKEKIVKLVKKCDWANVGLDWKEKESKNTEIFFTPEIEK